MRKPRMASTQIRSAKRFSPFYAPLPRSPTADRSLIKIEEQQSHAVHINLGCVILSEMVK
jgi:hypothetical protein